MSEPMVQLTHAKCEECGMEWRVNYCDVEDQNKYGVTLKGGVVFAPATVMRRYLHGFTHKHCGGRMAYVIEPFGVPGMDTPEPATDANPDDRYEYERDAAPLAMEDRE